MEGQGLWNHVICGMTIIVTSPLSSQVMYKIDLAFCASYEDGTSANRELPVLAAKANGHVLHGCSL